MDHVRLSGHSKSYRNLLVQLSRKSRNGCAGESLRRAGYEIPFAQTFESVSGQTNQAQQDREGLAETKSLNQFLVPLLGGH